MSNVAGIVLYNVLKSPQDSTDIWPKLKLYHFNKEYSQIYAAVSKYYNKYNKLPSFDDLKITLRDEFLLNKIRALELLPVSEDIDSEIATEALIDQYTQEETLNQLSTFVDNIVHYDTVEVKQKIADILLLLEQRTESSEDIFLMNDIFVIDEQEVLNKIPLGFNNTLDARDGGTALTELLMIGGRRGSGKTIAACNANINQYTQGNSSVIFSIEMRGREIFDRYISILSGVENNKLRRMACDKSDLDKIAVVRSNMFVDAEEVYRDYKKHEDYEKFEIDLIRSKKLKPDNQLVIVDNQNLTIADIDMNIQKFKNQFGDKLKVVVVDYVNQISVPDIYNWQVQIMLSNKLKEFARKYNIIMITPYQTDASGEARFAKGLLDKADVAMNLSAKDEYIHFESTKTRSIAPFSFDAPINWDTYAMSAKDAVTESETGEAAQEI